jgi:hypothetical protein
MSRKESDSSPKGHDYPDTLLVAGVEPMIVGHARTSTVEQTAGFEAQGRPQDGLERSRGSVGQRRVKGAGWQRCARRYG